MNEKTTGRLDREAVKQYLQQYHVAKTKKTILENRRRALSEELRSPASARPFGMATAGKNTTQDKTVSVVIRISEVEERIEKQREEMAKAVLNVMDIIDLLPANSVERSIVEMRHIDGMTWERIADAVPMARSNVINHYNDALETLLTYKRTEKLVGDYARANHWAGTSKHGKKHG